MANYTQTTDHRIKSRLNERYHAEITALENLGFYHLAYCIEDHGPYSAIAQYRIIPLAFRHKEYLMIKWPFRLASANVLMASEDPPSIALCMGMGIKIYTAFSEGTVVISSTFFSSMVPREGAKIIRLPHQRSLQEAWSAHKAEVIKKSREVEYLTDVMTFGDYVLMSGIEEDPSQYTRGK
jgi:hypothetical protein